MAKILNIIKGLNKTDGDIGVEIEVEGKNLPEARFTKNWRRERDGSLRGEESGEYVLKAPLSLPKLKESLEELDELFTLNGTIMDNSFRAGIHIHVNCQDLTAIQLFNFITLFFILEEPIVNMFDKSRVGNHFCLRAKDAGFLPQHLWDVAYEGDFNKLNTEEIRYSAMNITSIFKYGSVEFRMPESTRDFNKIYEWAEMFYMMKEKAKEYKDPQAVIYSFSFEGVGTFVNNVLGKYSKQVFSQKGWDKMIKSGIRIAQDIAFSRTWGAINLDIFDKNSSLL